MTRRRACVLRLHEAQTRINWGGRSTSLALARLVERQGGREIVSTIGAPHILGRLGDVDVRRAGRSVFEVVDELAAQIAAPRPATEKLAQVRAALTAADELVVNGEGDFILTERLTLVRTLAMMRAARLLDRPVLLLNSILSHAPSPPPSEDLVIDEVGATLALCDVVRYRDPVSLALHEKLYPDVAADWLPDALFAWAPDAARGVGLGPDGFGPAAEGLPIPVQRMLADASRYLVVSGTSRAGVDPARFAATLDPLARRLADRGVAVVLAGSDGPDRDLAGATAHLPVHQVDPRVPLSAAAALLWNAVGLVSGRYHPSILASLGGTPFLLMESNSHKTSSLLDVVDNGWRTAEMPFLDSGDGPVEHADRVGAAVEELLDGASTRSRVARSAAAAGDAVTRGVADLA
jgi:hypothetical protein